VVRLHYSTTLSLEDHPTVPTGQEAVEIHSWSEENKKVSAFAGTHTTRPVACSA